MQLETGISSIDDLLFHAISPCATNMLQEGKSMLIEEFKQLMVDEMGVHVDAADLISCCLMCNPADRPTTRALLQSSYLQQ